MAASEKKVRVRLAPSPTGPFHIGTARTALFNWLFARQNGGTFVLRIEDTDKARSEKKYEAEIFEGLRWLGLNWDEGPIAAAPTEDKKLKTKNQTGNLGPYRQSERTGIYKKYLERLLEEKKVYYCYCTKEELEAQREALVAQGLPPKYSGHCRNLVQAAAENKPQAIRFKMPEMRVEFKDMIRGKVSFDTALFGDIVIAKDLESALYNFAVVVDDHEMQISHVIRGEDHISNTPKQIALIKALGFEEPEYAHLPLILNSDRSKMSKRFADTALSEYRSRGYLPEAIANFLSLLGWHPTDDREIFSLEELTKEFELKRVQKAGAVFNQEKLNWLNGEYLRKKNIAETVVAVKALLAREDKPQSIDDDFLKRLILVERPRATTLRDFIEKDTFFFSLPDYDAKLLVWQKQPSAEKTKQILEECVVIMEEQKKWDKEALSSAFSALSEKEGRGAVLWPLRVALSGLSASPDPMEILEVLGKAESVKRVKHAVAKLKAII